MEWRTVKGFEGVYEVSNLGVVKSLGRYENGHTGKKYSTTYYRKEKTLKQCLRKGYPFVCLRKDGKTYNKSVHRLVAEAFIPNPSNLSEVNHKDENPLNNNVENLEWCDRKYNNNYGSRNEKSASKHRKPINQFDLNGVFIKQFKSQTEASKELNIQQANINKCLNGLRNKAGNFIWKYAA